MVAKRAWSRSSKLVGTSGNHRGRKRVPKNVGGGVIDAAMPASFAECLAGLDALTAGYLDTPESHLTKWCSPVRLDDAGGLHMSPLAAEDSDQALGTERDALVARIHSIQVAEILTDVDRDTSFSAQSTRGSENNIMSTSRSTAAPRPLPNHHRTLRPDSNTSLNLALRGHGYPDARRSDYAEDGHRNGGRPE